MQDFLHQPNESRAVSLLDGEDPLVLLPEESPMSVLSDGWFSKLWSLFGSLIWEFPKIGGTLFWGPYNKDPTIRVLY